MENLLKPDFFNTPNDMVKTMMSTVISATLPKTTNTKLTKPVNFTLKHIRVRDWNVFLSNLRTDEHLKTSNIQCYTIFCMFFLLFAGVWPKRFPVLCVLEYQRVDCRWLFCFKDQQQLHCVFLCSSVHIRSHHANQPPIRGTRTFIVSIEEQHRFGTHVLWHVSSERLKAERVEFGVCDRGAGVLQFGPVDLCPLSVDSYVWLDSGSLWLCPAGSWRLCQGTVSCLIFLLFV